MNQLTNPAASTGPFYYVHGITNQTLNLTISLFSLQDALDINPDTADDNLPYDAAPFLFHDACGIGNGTQNCTSACSDEATIFGSLDTLHNCVMYPTIADQYNRNNLSSEVESLAVYLGIVKSEWNSTLSRNISKTISTCLVDYCAMLPGCTVDSQSYNDPNDQYDFDFVNISSPFFYNPDDEYSSSFDLCEYLPASVNPDIGGIGVYISYWIQAGLAILGFLATVWWNWGISLCYLIFLTPRNGISRAIKKAQIIRIKFRQKRLAGVASALTAFHKAQCFFMLAINIAAQVNRSQGGFQPSSLQQLYNTYVLIKCISIGGYLPITFMLFNLHLVEMISWYLLLLSTCTVAVSAATLFTIGNFSPSPNDMTYLSSQAGQGGPQSCGGNLPGAYCLITLYYASDTDPSNGAYSMLAFCLVVLVLLIAHQFEIYKLLPAVQIRQLGLAMARLSEATCSFSLRLWRRLLDLPWTKRSKRWASRSLFSKGFWTSKLRESKALAWIRSPGFTSVQMAIDQLLGSLATFLRWDRRKPRFDRLLSHAHTVISASDWPLFLRRFFVFAIYITFFGLYMRWFKIFFTDLAWFASNGVDHRSWSFGQIVAITVWAEPLCEYIYLEMRGMKRGFEYRLLPPYRVVKGGGTQLGTISEDVHIPNEERAFDQEKGYQKVGYSASPITPEQSGRLEKDSYETVDFVNLDIPARRSTDELKWHLPETVLFDGSLSPF